MVFFYHLPFPIAPRHPKGNPRSKVITSASQLLSSSHPASSSTVPIPSSITVSVTASSKEFRRLLHDFGYNYCLIESDKDDIIEASDMKALSEMYSKLEDHLVSSFFVCTIFIDLFIEAH